MTDAGFLPPNYAKTFAAQVLADFRRQNRLIDIAHGIDPDNRPSVGVSAPIASEWLEQRAEFAQRWQALLDEGLEHGYLADDGDGVVMTEHTTAYVSRPNPEYDPDRPNPYAMPEGATHITIPIIRRNA